VIITALRDQYVYEGEFFKAAELYDAPPYEPEEKLIFGPILQVADEIRRRWGRPIPCTSGVRTPEKQRLLIRRGLSTAKHSPHVYRIAMDLDVATPQETRDLAALARRVSKDLGIPIRIGWMLYLRRGQTFIHIDCGPLVAYLAHREGLIPEGVKEAWLQVTEW